MPRVTGAYQGVSTLNFNIIVHPDGTAYMASIEAINQNRFISLPGMGLGPNPNGPGPVQADPISGSAHFRTSVEKGLEIIAGLRGHTTGYAVPTYVIDAPGGGGKVPVSPEYVLSRNADRVVIRNYEGKIFEYPEGTDGTPEFQAPNHISEPELV